MDPDPATVSAADGRVRAVAVPISPLDAVTSAVASSAALDPLAAATRSQLAPLARAPARPILAGEWLGHALHPLLTDLPIGFWTTSFVLDLVGGRTGRDASQRCVALGLMSVPLTAAAGWSDWIAATSGQERDDEAVRRTGVAHAALNLGATAAYAASWRARRHDRHLRGVSWGMVGATLASVAGHLGGHLVFRLGVGVRPGPDA